VTAKKVMYCVIVVSSGRARHIDTSNCSFFTYTLCPS